MRSDVTGELRKMHDDGLHSLSSFTRILNVLTSRQDKDWPTAQMEGTQIFGKKLKVEYHLWGPELG
jgi:hypothetical protein